MKPAHIKRKLKKLNNEIERTLIRGTVPTDLIKRRDELIDSINGTALENVRREFNSRAEGLKQKIKDLESEMELYLKVEIGGECAIKYDGENAMEVHRFIEETIMRNNYGGCLNYYPFGNKITFESHQINFTLLPGMTLYYDGEMIGVKC